MAKGTRKPNPQPKPEVADEQLDYEDLDLEELDDVFTEEDLSLDDPEPEPMVRKKASNGKAGRIPSMPAVEVDDFDADFAAAEPKLSDFADAGSGVSVLPALLDRIQVLEQSLSSSIEAVNAKVASVDSKLCLQLENVYKGVKAAETSLQQRLETLDRFLSDEFGYGDNRETILQEIHEAVIGEGEAPRDKTEDPAPVKATKTTKPSKGCDPELAKKMLRVINKQKNPVPWATIVTGLAGHLKLSEPEVTAALNQIGFKSGEKVLPGKIPTPE